MPDQELYVAGIRSNIDRLSTAVIRDGLTGIVRRELEEGEAAMKALIPKDTHAAEKAVGHSGPYDTGLVIEGKVGVGEAIRDWYWQSGSFRYPIFLARGTGIYGDKGEEIFAKRAKFMKLPPKEPFNIYHKRTKGQKPKDYPLATFLEMTAALQVNGEIFKVDVTEKLEAAKL